MKILYKLCILGILCLVSNITYAQINQYSNDGKVVALDDPGGGNEGLNCFCFGPVNFGLFNNAISPIAVGNERNEFLYRQELLLAQKIDPDGINYYQLYQEFNLPSSYNFSFLLYNYIRTKETNTVAQDYYVDVDQYFKEKNVFNRDVLNSSTLHHKILDIRQREGNGISASYGDLKYNGTRLKDISDPDVLQFMTYELALREQQRDAYRGYNVDATKLEDAKGRGMLENKLTEIYMHYYDGLSYEDQIRYVTRFRIADFSQDRSILIESHLNFNAIFRLDSDNPTLTKELGDYLLSFPYNITIDPPVFNEISDGTALYNLALSNMGATTSNFLLFSGLNFRSVLEGNTYSRGILDRVVNTTSMYQNNQPFTGAFDPYITAGSGTSLSLPTDLGVDLAYKFTFNTAGEINGLRGYSNMLYDLFNLDDNHRALEGSLMRAFFNADQHNLYTLTDDQLARLFNFSTVYPYGTYRFNFFLEYANTGIKGILEQNNIDFFTMLDRPYVIEGTIALLNNQPFDFAFREMVYDLSNALSLNQDQKDWLIDHRAEAEALDQYYTTTNNINFANEALNAWMNGGDVDFDERVIEEESFENSKANCVYEKLKERSQGLRDLIRNFLITNPVNADLTFRVAPIQHPNPLVIPNANTSSPRNGMITITINENNLADRTELGLARTIVHEAIHANMYRQLLQVFNNNGSISGISHSRFQQILNENKFPDMFAAIRQYGFDRFQHDLMAEKYLGIIVDAIKAYDKNQHSEQFYKDLAWGGLHNTEAYRELPDSEERRIEQVIENFNATGNKICE
ncbi:hypothetical protein [Aquimarina mytili]|uniref:Uncharacterized protein n=1 Tax=Aquimarina mytili TaxID=874423 RepID=A0A937A0K7_9FLAO|nr:hypothetical protein [Aquimarina mytili]MBL0685791.1 hypothetical protein [Aquimarina mytili]